MKKLLALLLALMTLVSVFTACNPQKNTSSDPEQNSPTASAPTNPSEDLPTATPTPTPTPTPEPEPLPSSFSLQGTKHLPVVDSQGSIGCCTSQGVTYTQFTVAVSQYINSLDPNSEWNPSSGNTSYIFSPKFTYNYSGSGTDFCYQVLRDNGCLPMSLSVFDKTAGSPETGWGGSILNSEKSRAWDITSPDLMLAALNYRITNYEEIEYGSTNNGQLTTNKAGQDLLYKVKAAIAKGNAVAVCGWSSYWEYDKIDVKGLGTLGKRGDSIIWNGYKNNSSTSDGNHCVALVGYDDDITYSRAGVTMKGAFLMMNSWGTGYYQGGFCWIAYDAFNAQSEFSILNDPDFYEHCLALSPANLKSIIPMNSITALEMTFTPVAKEQTVEGQTCTVYTISNGNGKYLSYNGKGEISYTEELSDKCHFAVLDSKQSDIYSGSKYLYAVNTNSPAKYLAFENTSSGSGVKLVTKPVNSTACLKINDGSANGEGVFVDMINTVPAQDNYERTGTMYRFSFLYWDKDIAVGPSKLSVEVEVEALDRNNLYITLNRTDRNGVQDTFAPASMELRYKQSVVPETAEIKEGETLSFSGIINPTEKETGFFVFTYDTLLGFNNQFSYNDFLWGVNVRGSDVTVKQIRLLDEQGKEIYAVKPDVNAGAMVKGEIHKFVFDSGNEPKAFFGTGTYKLKNVGTGKVLSLASNNMLFTWFDGKKANEEKSAFTINYDKKADVYTIRSYKDYVVDIHKEKIEDGVIVKMNAVSDTRKTQRWMITQTADGYLQITLKDSPEYAFGYADDFCISKSKNDKNFLWTLEPVEPANITFDITSENGKVTINTTTANSGAHTVKIVKDGAVVTTLEGTAAKNSFTAETTLEKGTYLFTLIYEGEEVGTQTIYKVN